MQRRFKSSVPMPKAFNRLLVAWFASVTGDGMRFAALPLLALNLSPSPAAVSAVAAATMLPWLLIALPAGALVDRLDPATVIAGANACRAVAVTVLVAAVLTDWAGIGLLCAVGFVLTAGETFADSAGQSLLVRIVPTDRLETANARFVSSENVGLDLVGPLAAGALFTVAPWLPFAIAAAIFLATGYGVQTLRGHRADGHRGPAADGAGDLTGPVRVSPGPVGDGPGPVIGSPGPAADGGPSAVDRADWSGHVVKPRPGMSVRAGFRVIFSDPALRALVVTVAIMAAAIAAAEGVLVVYSASSLRLTDAWYPTLLASYSVGLLLAAGAVSRWGAPVRPGLMMVGAVALIGVTLVLLGVFPYPWVAWCSFLAMGAAGGVWNVLSASRRQRRTPQSMIARVSSTFRAISWGALPLGTALGGLIGEVWSVPTVFVVAGLVVLALSLAASRFLIAGGDDDPSADPARAIPAVGISGAAGSV